MDTYGTDNERQHEAIREQLGAFAFGDLSPEEHALVRDHLAGCAACRDELAELRAALSALPLMLDEMVPPAGLRDRIEAAVLAEAAETMPRPAAPPIAPVVGWPTPPLPLDRRSTAPWSSPVPTLPRSDIAPPMREAPIPLPPPRRRANLGWLAAAALLLLSLGLFGWNLRLRDEIDEVESMVAGLVPTPVPTLVALAPEPPAPDAAGEVRVEPDDGLIVLDVRGLPPLAPGQVYQAWLIGPASDAPVPVGTFGASTARHAIAADLSQGWTTLAITAEPGPLGSPGPTGEIVATAPLA